MAGRKSAEKAAYWREMLAAQAESGRSIRQFCLQQGVSQPSFYAWRRRLAEARGGGRESRTSGRRAQASPKGGDFISLRLVDTASSLEVIHPRGCRIRITGDVDPTTLRRVLDALDAEGQA